MHILLCCYDYDYDYDDDYYYHYYYYNIYICKSACIYTCINIFMYPRMFCIIHVITSCRQDETGASHSPEVALWELARSKLEIPKKPQVYTLW